MSVKTQEIVVCSDELSTIELKVLQNWAIANAEGDDMTLEEVATFNAYRESAQGQADYNSILANAPDIDNVA
jgi:hypothetical protein|tara:strand:+ start:578 stop:793 length:216 start_codon:yes stop_codon:yes gene_type:complete